MRTYCLRKEDILRDMKGINVINLYKSYKNEIIEEGIKGSIKGIFRRNYSETIAIDDVSLKIENGEMVGLIGPNGAGKTTFLKLLSGVLYPDKGKIDIDGYDPARRDRRFLENITFFTGQRSFLSVIIWDIAPRDGFELIRHIYNIDKTTFKKRLSYFTEILNAEEIISKPLRKLSLGERTKVEIIASLIHFPKYVFLDEPTIGLDVISQKTLWDFFKRYNKEQGATLIITSHYVRDIEELGKRIIILNRGKILYDGDKDGIRRKMTDKKIIKFKTAIESVKIPFEKDEDSFIIEVEKKDIEKVIKKIMNIGEIEDIEIKDPPFEMIIREIFKAE